MGASRSSSRGPLLLLLALDLAGSAATTLVVASGRGGRARLGAVAAVAASGVGTAAPMLMRAARSHARRDVDAALATVAVGLVWNTAGALAVARAAGVEPDRTAAAARLLLVLGDAISVGYLVELVRMRRSAARTR
ncbi:MULTISPECIES: hypothetical protein [unclassified Agrococcus]|uniref:hypothetical protein n=1 Tax=unclassified Agrococcus TaxID=2615065 RepID=UPI00361D965A